MLNVRVSRSGRIALENVERAVVNVSEVEMLEKRDCVPVVVEITVTLSEKERSAP